MPELWEMIFGEKLINGFSSLRIFTRAYCISGFVNHPQFSNGSLLFDSWFSKSFHFGIVRYKHVFINSFTIDSHETEFDDLFCLSTWTYWLETDPSWKSYQLIIVWTLLFDYLAKSEQNFCKIYHHLSNNYNTLSFLLIKVAI